LFDKLLKKKEKIFLRTDKNSENILKNDKKYWGNIYKSCLINSKYVKDENNGIQSINNTNSVKNFKNNAHILSFKDISYTNKKATQIPEIIYKYILNKAKLKFHKIL
jgi:hypothetical protein